MAHKMTKFSRRNLLAQRRWYWRFEHENGNFMAGGLEGYNTRRARDDSYRSFIAIVENGDYVEEDLDENG